GVFAQTCPDIFIRQNWHPHVHVSVTCGGIDEHGKWKKIGGKNTVKYLGRYLKKPPIAGSRLAHYAGSATLSFRYHDHNTGELATETLTQRDIVARLKQHIPEKFFRKRTASDLPP
ncbi:transposase, partial [Klebsiella pneumoniae]|uniref:transposase n=1 Tax=Klebsiella pneumoniae TaxID=573 RepID=UPI001556D0DB